MVTIGEISRSHGIQKTSSCFFRSVQQNARKIEKKIYLYESKIYSENMLSWKSLPRCR